MLDVMFAAPHAEKDFGVQLSAGNLDSVLAAQHAEQRAFQQTHPIMSRDLHERAAAILSNKKINGTACGKTE